MQTDKAIYDSSIYTNVQGLKSLQHEYKSNKEGVQKEVSQQFESLLVQILMKSMRDANKALGGGLLSTDQADFYGDLLDKQLSLVMSKSGVGVSKTLETWIDKTAPEFVAQKAVKEVTGLKQASPALKAVSDTGSKFATASDFVKNLWGSATQAAKLIGVDPKLLLAQAALETAWGKKIVPLGGGKSSHNLFNIKAGENWVKDTANFQTIEEKEGVLVKENAQFRAYDSFQDSFHDYAQFLQHNSRYSEALKNAPDPQKFISSLQKANYATDHQYSDKIMAIYNSKKFNDLFEQNKLV